MEEDVILRDKNKVGSGKIIKEGNGDETMYGEYAIKNGEYKDRSVEGISFKLRKKKLKHQAKEMKDERHNGGSLL